IARPKTRPLRDGLIAVYITDHQWAGFLNPNHKDTNPGSILFFGGFGRDGDGDGKADLANDTDVLYSIASFLLRYGTAPEDFDIAMWEYYHNDRSVKRIRQFAQIYRTFG